MIIWFIDLLSPKGHKVFNTLTLKSILKLKNTNIMIIGSRNNISKEFNIDYEIPNRYFPRTQKTTTLFFKIKYRFLEMKKWLWIIKILKKNKPNLIIFSSYETITFAIFSRFIPYKTAIFNHNNIDELKSRLKKIFFKSINKKVIHIVFEDYIRDYLAKELNIKNKIVVLPHIVKPQKNINFKIKIPQNNDFLVLFAPSSQNNKTEIHKLIKNKERLKDKKIRVIAKYDLEITKEEVFISKKYFTDSEYNDYMQTCTAVFIPFSKNFNFRISNVINEAISYGKPIISTPNRYTIFLKEKYPSIIYLLERDILEEIENIRIWINNIKDSYSKDREKFLKDHSEEKFIKAFQELLKA